MSPWVGIRRLAEGSRELFFVLNSHWDFLFFSFLMSLLFFSDVEESVYLLWFHMIEVPPWLRPALLVLVVWHKVCYTPKLAYNSRVLLP